MVAARKKSKTIKVYSPEWLEAVLVAADCHASELARLLDITPNSVSRWRRGINPINHMTAVAILAVLELPLDWKPPDKDATA